jgi:hypothetical protein
LSSILDTTTTRSRCIGTGMNTLLSLLTLVSTVPGCVLALLALADRYRAFGMHRRRARPRVRRWWWLG